MKKQLLTVLLVLSLDSSAFAATYHLPLGSDTIVGTDGAGVILPPVPREGIVINLSEMRLYYYPKDSTYLKTYRVGIGKLGKTMPIERTYVSKKVVNPIWTPTPDIREYNRAKGIILPAFIPPGPDNPLGPFAIYLGASEYRIHSTIFPESIGRRASFGCIRMVEEDIRDLFPIVPVRTPVNVIDQPVILGWMGNKLYLEVHTPLEERQYAAYSYDGMVDMIERTIEGNQVAVNWQAIDYIARHHDGAPHEIGIRAGG
jgi:L,D-transpeptidase ErfK/SrfK